MQVKIYITGITLRQARLLRFLFKRNGGGRFDLIRPIGASHAVYECEAYGEAGSRVFSCFATPDPRMRYLASRCMATCHHD